MKELNEKLAKWRWPDGHIVLFKNLQIISVIDKDEDISTTIEYFTHSTDAIFKWLVPELSIPIIYLELDPECDGAKGWDCILALRNTKGDTIREERSWANTPALALCKAIEQVIDNE